MTATAASGAPREQSQQRPQREEAEDETDCKHAMAEDAVAATAASPHSAASPSLSALSPSLRPSSPFVAGSPLVAPSTPSARRLLVSLSGRHLPRGLDPLACVLLLPPSASGAERLLGHTEIVRSAMSPQWQRVIAIERSSRRGQTVRIALFDAAHIGRGAAEAADQGQTESSGTAAAVPRRASLLDRLLRRRRLPASTSTASSSSSDSSSSSSSLFQAELRSEDAIGCALLSFDELCHGHRFHVQQRLPLRHTFDSEIDKRLQRLNAHLLVTVRPESSQQQSYSALHSPRLSAQPSLSLTGGPSCAVPFEAAYRLLCQGAEMWKFAAFSSARPQRRLVFYARHPLSAKQLHSAEPNKAAMDGDSMGSMGGSSAPNPLFPLGLLYWCPPGKRLCDSARCVPLHSITALYERCQTAAFASILRERDRLTHRSIQPVTAAASATASSSRQRGSQLDSLPLELGFSVVSPQRTLDLLPDSPHIRDVFLSAIHGILLQHARICFEDSSAARAEEAKRTEERRRYNERQLEGAVAVSFNVKHLPLPASSPDTADTQVCLMLSKQLTVASDDDTVRLASDEGRSVLLASSEWMDVDDVITFAHIFTLELPVSSSVEQSYQLSVVDLRHRTLATATFSSLLLFHHHLDIPLSLRHSVHSLDALLTFNRTCANMRVSPLTGRDTAKADILDVITLLQSQPAAPADLPYLTLAFMLRGEMCDHYGAPAFSVQRTTLLYNHDSRGLQLAGHSLPLSSLLTVHRQLRAASELTDSLCAVHPEKRVNSRRMLVLHTADCGSFVCEMRSVMAADAWVTGIRQMMSKRDDGRAAASRAELEHEQLNWAHFDIAADDDETAQLDDGGAEDDELVEAAADTRPAEAEKAQFGSPASPALESGSEVCEEPELRIAAPHPTLFFSFPSPLNGLLPLHSEDDEEGAEDSAAEEDSDEYDAAGLSTVDLSDAHLIPRPSQSAVRRLSHSSGLHSPFIHSRSPSFSSLHQPGFHLTPPMSPANDQDDSEKVEAESELVLLSSDADVPAAPPLLGTDGDVPMAPPMDGDVPAAPPLSGDGVAVQASTANRLKKLHWDAISGEEGTRGTIFESLQPQLDQSTVEAIEALFAAVVPPKPSDGVAAAESVARAVELIDRRRAQNVSIALRGLKLSVAEIVRALQECDVRLLSVERLQQLTVCLPDAVEAKQIKAYVGDVERLGPAEQFMLATLSMPRCAVRVQLLLFMATFDDAVSQLSAHCHCVQAACEAVRGSERLAAAMQGVLAVGGLLSGKRASGFHLSSLDKLHALKSSQQQQQQQGQLSLLDFIVEREVSRAQTADGSGPRADRLFFDSLDVDKLRAAAKLDWQAVQTDIRSLQEQLKALRREMDRADDSKPSSQPQSHRRSQSQLGQSALSAAIRSFLSGGAAAVQGLLRLHGSASATLRVTLSYFAEADGSPQSLFASLERFIASFTASERRYWQNVDKRQRQRAMQLRKEQQQQLSDARSSPSKQAYDSPSAAVEAKGGSEVEAAEQQRLDIVDGRLMYETSTERSLPLS